VDEGWDWTLVQEEACPQCGFDPSRVAVGDLARAVQAQGGEWVDWLTEAEADPEINVRARPDTGVWSPLEYASHVRDVLALFAQRVTQALDEDEPELAWWDHEAAAVDELYNAQDPAEVAGQLTESALDLARVLASVPDDGWTRTARRREGERFTIAGLGRFALHESHHHLADARGDLRAE
jgi:hypothetical protein